MGTGFCGCDFCYGILGLRIGDVDDCGGDGGGDANAKSCRLLPRYCYTRCHRTCETFFDCYNLSPSSSANVERPLLHHSTCQYESCESFDRAYPPPLQTTIVLIEPILLSITTEASKPGPCLIPLFGSKRSIVVVCLFDDVLEKSGIRFGCIRGRPRFLSMMDLMILVARRTSSAVKHSGHTRSTWQYWISHLSLVAPLHSRRRGCG